MCVCVLRMPVPTPGIFLELKKVLLFPQLPKYGVMENHLLLQAMEDSG